MGGTPMLRFSYTFLEFSAFHCLMPARRFPIEESEQKNRRGWAFAQHAPVTYVKFRKSYGERRKATQSKGWRAKRWILIGLQRCPSVDIPLPFRSGRAAVRFGPFRFCTESAFMERVMAVKAWDPALVAARPREDKHR
jgi:hypothetical protein